MFLNFLEAYEILFEFLKQEYSEENLLFITEVKEYKQIRNNEKRKEKAEEIIAKYIKQNAELEVIVDEKIFPLYCILICYAMIPVLM